MEHDFGVSEIYEETGILYVDNSILSALALCETQAMMQYGYHLVPADDSRGPMRAGTAVHKALEVHYTGGTVDEAISALWEDYYEYATENEPVTSRLSYDNVVEVVRSWIWHHPLKKLPYKIIEGCVEMPFDLPLSADGDIRFVGCIDAAATRTDGQGLYLIDNKSSGRLDDKFYRQFELGSQMTGYWWALEQIMDRPVTAVHINAIDMRTVPRDPKRKCKTHRSPYADCGYLHMNHKLGGPYYRNKPQLATWKKNALHLAKQWRKLLDKHMDRVNSIVDVPQSGLFTYQACSLCAYDKFCKGDRNVNAKGQLFHFIPWLPGPLADLYTGD